GPSGGASSVVASITFEAMDSESRMGTGAASRQEADPMSAHLRVEHLCVAYPGAAASTVEDLSLALAHGEIGCLLGASGCGKTTVLRALAGFLAPRGGVIE